jgi:hypothetical protein
VECTTLASAAAALGIARVDLIWMDLQGAELLALQGMGDLLNGVRYVHTELSFRAMYTATCTRGASASPLEYPAAVGRRTEFIGTRGFEANVFFLELSVRSQTVS